MITNLTAIPTLDRCALDYSEQLIAKIKQEIHLKGPISFARFMELALYAPGLGYYVAGSPKFGKEGDFTTAPEISILYSHCIARQCQQVLSHCPGDILEFGGGSGVMAVEILLELDRLNTLPNHYYIVEVSADLKQRQEELINHRAPHLKHKVIWRDTLENFSLEGIIIANEVIDAFPVHRFRFEQNNIQELYVTVDQQNFKLIPKTPSAALLTYLQQTKINFAQDYESECNLYALGWINSLSQILNKGAIILIDYGFPRHEFYHPDRNKGTLMCHYHHQAHDDPFAHVGLQDITAHVDFTAIAEAAVHADLSVVGFTNQASFLIACGITDILQNQTLNVENYAKRANEIKILTSPSEMGELFKVMGLTKNLDIELLGFSLRNMCERL